MPAKPLMSWEGKPQFRWVKQRSGIRYRVTCEELGLPRGKWTKDGSYLQANEWWRRKLADLGSIAPEADPEKSELLETVDRLIDWAATHDPDEAERLRASRKAISASPVEEVPHPDQDALDENLATARLFGVTVPDDVDPEVLRHLFGNRRIYQDRLKRHHKVKREQTIGYALDVFFENLRLRQEPATHDEINRCLSDIPTSVWSRETDAASVSEHTVLAHYRWLVAQKLVAGSHNKRLGFFRRFVKWLYEQRLIDALPRNLTSKDHRKKIEHVEVKSFHGIKQFVEELPLKHKAWALLCLNCGMTAADLGKLFWADGKLALGDVIQVGDEAIKVQGLIAAETWTVRRRRSKTGKNPKTPTVTYKLWPETVAVLKDLPRTGLVFVTETGAPMYVVKYKDAPTGNATTTKKDLFGDYWRGQRIPFGKLRSIAADRLYGHELYRQYKDYFLAHKPNTVADIHYGSDKDEPFFRALEFVRTELFGEDSLNV